MKNIKISVIGLGYVGLPLAMEFGKHFKVIGFDKNEDRVLSLKNSIDKTGEVPHADFSKSKKITFSSDVKSLKDSDFLIVCVPTPVNNNSEPDLSYLEAASEIVAHAISKKKHSIVIYESTVYPGVTEDVCIPIIENLSHLSLNKDFSCGYSPERINPGDKERGIRDIIKVVSASNVAALKKVDDLYSAIVEAGTYCAPSIKVAEAAKAIENTQRDLNIAFFNELSKLFKTLDIDTKDVIDTASTKWNFIPFKPGLVGGHCIGVDPFYLTHVAKKNNFYPKVILAGRETNDKMHEFIGFSLINDMLDKKLNLVESSILVLGATFKQNCPDLRNSKSLEFADYLAKLGPSVTVHDPVANQKELKNTLKSFQINAKKKITLKASLKVDLLNNYDAIILAVSHDNFIIYKDLLAHKNMKNKVIYDLQSFLPRELVSWRL